MKAFVHISLKNSVLDPQGKAIGNALATLGFDTVSSVRQGKYIILDLDENALARARTLVEKMCKRLLANTVIEDYRIDLEG